MSELHRYVQSPAERRLAQRVPLAVQVECRTRKTCVHGECDNVSELGILVVATETFHEGDTVSLRFALPPKPKGPIIRAEGVVIRAKNCQSMAIQFVGLHQNHRSAISQFVARYVSEPELLKPSYSRKN
jgi:hypothetical protein